MRKSRNRRGSRRVVRKNKTMRGGIFGNWKYATVDADVFRATGYKRAKDALSSYPVAKWPPFYRMPNNQSKLNVYQISEAYNKYSSGNGDGKTVPKYTYKKSLNGYTYEPTSAQIEILDSDAFKEVLTYVVENKGDEKSGPVQNVRNERYANFAESLDKFIQNTTDPLLKGMAKTTPASNLSGAVSNLGSVASGLFQNTMASPGGQKLAAGAQNALGVFSKGIPKSGNAGVDFMVQRAANNAGTVAKAGSWFLSKQDPAKLLGFAKSASDAFKNSN